MGRISSIPINYDDLKTLDISKFKEWGYLKGDKVYDFQVLWSREGVKTASIRCVLDLANRKMELIYSYNDAPVNMTYLIASKSSNLGRGEVFYFVCRRSYKRCRKLYLQNGEFVHRSLIEGYYFSQLVPVKERSTVSMYRKHFEHERLLHESYKKHYRKYYKGKMTKRYLRLREYGA